MNLRNIATLVAAAFSFQVAEAALSLNCAPLKSYITTDSSYMVMEGYRVEKKAIITLRMAYGYYCSLRNKEGELSRKQFIGMADKDKDGVITSEEADDICDLMIDRFAREN